MHEMSLAQSIIDIAEEQARKEGYTRVTKVFLRIGALAHVDPRALELGFETVRAGTIAEGAAVIIERAPGKAFCVTCGLTIEVRERSDPCPHCGQYQLLLVAGEDMRVTELEVE